MRIHTSSPLFVDFYELTMAQGFFLNRSHRCPATFDYFFRKNPFSGGYTVFAGLEELLEAIIQFKFKKKDLRYLQKQGFNQKFLNYLETFSFTGNIRSVREGEVVFPEEPILIVESSILEAQILETLILNTLNFQSLIATKASRVVKMAGQRPVIDFGLRRAQGLGGLQASRAAYIGGVSATSNVLAGERYGVPVTGTMAHSWIQSFSSEIESFRSYVHHYPESAILLIDTYNTLNSGLPNAIRVAKEMRKRGDSLKGVRLDSGDLAYLSKKVRKALDKEGLREVKVIVSGSLDEHIIESLNEQKGSIDGFGVGTKLATAFDSPALDGVYKLSTFDKKDKLKVSDNLDKINLPGRKMILRYYRDDGKFLIDGILLEGEKNAGKLYHPVFEFKNYCVKQLYAEEIHCPMIRSGKLCYKKPSLKEIRDYQRQRLDMLPAEHKRFQNPHIYRVGISRKLFTLRKRLSKQGLR